MLAACATMVVGETFDEHGRFTADPSACVMVDQSDGWNDGASQTDRFSTRFMVRRDVWVPRMRFIITWAEFATVDNAYGVTPKESSGLGDQGHSATFELTTDDAHLLPDGLPGTFQLLGHDTQLAPTSIVCSNETIVTEELRTSSDGTSAALPVHVPLNDCDLGAHWTLTNAYEQLAEAEIRIDIWEVGRRVTLTFANQEVTVANARNAVVVDTTTEGTDTIISFTLSAFGNSQLCETGHVENGQYVRDVNCGGPSGAEPTIFSFQLQPGPTTAPRVMCPTGGTQPPPPPNYFETATATATGFDAAYKAVQLQFPPPPSPPPLPAPSPLVRAAACSAGGLAAVQRVTRNVDQRTMRIVVKPDYLWPTGYGYVVGLKGLEMRVSQTVRPCPPAQLSGMAFALRPTDRSSLATLTGKCDTANARTRR